MHTRLGWIRASVDQNLDRITEFQATCAHLEQEVEVAAQRRRSAAQQSEEALRLLKQEFTKRQQQTQGLEAKLEASQRELHGAEQWLQVEAAP